MKGIKSVIISTSIIIVIVGVAILCNSNTKANSYSVDRQSKKTRQIKFEEGIKYTASDASKGAVLQAWCWSFRRIFLTSRKQDLVQFRLPQYKNVE